MAKREGKDIDGDEWFASFSASSASHAGCFVHLKLYLDGLPSGHNYTPTGARELAKALTDLADELDPEGANWADLKEAREIAETAVEQLNRVSRSIFGDEHEPLAPPPWVTVTRKGAN